MDNYRRVTADNLREKLRQGPVPTMLDFRSHGDFEQEHIAGSINVPLETFDVEKLVSENTEGPIYLLCTSGKRAYKAADLFYAMGFNDVIILAGGLLSWRVLGFPLEGKKHSGSSDKRDQV